MSSAIATRPAQRNGQREYEAVSVGSQTIQRIWSEEKNYLQGSASDWLPAVAAALRDIRLECGRANWDGPGSIAVTAQVIHLARLAAEALFALLPKGTPAPDVVPEADGEISISWTVDAARTFALSIGEHGKINFSGQFGQEGAVHAWQPFDASSPHAVEGSLGEIARQVRRLYTPPTVSSRT